MCSQTIVSDDYKLQDFCNRPLSRSVWIHQARHQSTTGSASVWTSGCRQNNIVLCARSRARHQLYACWGELACAQCAMPELRYCIFTEHYLGFASKVKGSWWIWKKRSQDVCSSQSQFSMYFVHWSGKLQERIWVCAVWGSMTALTKYNLDRRPCTQAGD